MKLYDDKFKKGKGYQEGKADAIDKDSYAKVFEYKKEVLKKFIAINPGQIDERLGDNLYWVTRKYDGEFAVILYEDGAAVTVNRSGRVRRGVPCIDDVAQTLKKNGVRQAFIPAEIYVYDEKKKTRVNDLVSALGDEKKLDTLRLACYDLLELNGKEFKPADYGETLEKLEQILTGAKLCHVVVSETAKSNDKVKDIYRIWVEEGNAEGLVVRSEMPFIWKVKPRHNIDAVVVGFTEGTGDQKGRVRTMLMALMPQEGKYQVITHVGGGMPENLKKELYEYFMPRVMNSDYLDSDSNHVAFRMVEPDRVLEFSVNDVRWENPGGLITNPVLEISEGRYRMIETVNGVSVVAPIFERLRDDKKADVEDTRLAQAEDIASYEPGEETARPSRVLRPSELLFREVYRKNLGSKAMVLKFMGWKTNKEGAGDYPAYVLHVTDFSSERTQRLQRDISITDDRKQLDELLKAVINANVKQGWKKVE